MNIFCQENNKSYIITSPLIKEHDDNELRINLATSIIGFPELNYERFIEDNMGVGLAGSVSLEKIEDMSMRWFITLLSTLFWKEKGIRIFYRR